MALLERPFAVSHAVLTLLLLAIVGACASPIPVPSPTTPSGTSRPSAQPPGTQPTATPVPTTSPAPSLSGGGTLGPKLEASLQSTLDQLRSDANVPGLSAAILLSDGSLWTGTSGDRQLSPATPVDANTVFAIASITKTFVAATVMEMVSEDTLSLSDSLDRWFPQIPYAKQITIGELLGHTSGIYNYFENPAYNHLVFEHPNKRWTFDQIMALVKAPYCKPGTCYHYSNTNFVLLGRIVELMTGDTIAGEIAKRFSDPLSLTQTSFQPDDPAPADRAHGYVGTRDWTRQSTVIPTMSAATVAWAAGSMVSTATDLARWASELYGGQVLPQVSLSQMEDVQECHDNYGLGTRKYVINGRVAYGHPGSLRGYSDAMWYFPAEGATIVLLSNLGIWKLDGAVRKLETVLFDGIGAAPPALNPNTNTRNHDAVTLRC